MVRLSGHRLCVTLRAATTEWAAEKGCVLLSPVARVRLGWGRRRMVPPLLRVDWSGGSGSALWRRRRSILRARLHCSAAMTNRDAAFVYALPLPDRARLGSTTRAAARWRRQRAAATTPRRPCTASSWFSPSGCSYFCGCCRRAIPGLLSAARDRAWDSRDERADTHVGRVAPGSAFGYRFQCWPQSCVARDAPARGTTGHGA